VVQCAVRAALEWLAVFTAQEQTYILPLSLQTLLGDAWGQGLATDNKSGTWDLPVGAQFFPGQAHVRLRGVGATIRTRNSDALYQAAFRVPAKAATTFLDGSSQVLDQSDAPLTRIGRIRVANSQLLPDTVGTLSLYNLEWLD
jgi:hypothetical protein